MVTIATDKKNQHLLKIYLSFCLHLLYFIKIKSKNMKGIGNYLRKKLFEKLALACIAQYLEHKKPVLIIFFKKITTLNIKSCDAA